MATEIRLPEDPRFGAIKSLADSFVTARLKADKTQRVKEIQEAVYGAKDRDDAIDRIKGVNILDAAELKSATAFTDTIWPARKITTATDKQRAIQDAVANQGLPNTPQNRTRAREVQNRTEKDLSRLEKIGADKFNEFNLTFSDSAPAFTKATSFYNENKWKLGPAKAFAKASQMLTKLKKDTASGEGTNTGKLNLDSGATTLPSIDDILSTVKGFFSGGEEKKVPPTKSDLPVDRSQWVDGKEYILADGTKAKWNDKRNGFVRTK